MRSRPWIGAGAVLALLGLAVVIWSTPTTQAFRVRYAINHTADLRNPAVSWKGKTVVVRGNVPNEAAFNQLSHKLARIVGADFVVNETQAPSAEHVVAPEERIGTVTIPVNTYYDDSPESLKLISAVLRLPQFETFNVATDETVSQVVLDRYRFGESNLPRSYALVASRIAEINGLKDANHIHPGLLKVPILPPRAQERSPAVVQPHPGFAFYGAMLAEVVSSPVVERAVYAPNVRPNVATFMLSVPVTPSTFAETKKTLPTLPVVTSSFKMTVRLADAGNTVAPANIHKTLNAQDSVALTAELAKKPRRHATVFILDDGWPDPTTYSESLNELQQLSNSVRDHYGFPHVDLESLPFVQSPIARPHSAYIRDAIREFTDLDKAKIVSVVYVPLSKAQNSSPVLQELLLLDYISSTVKGPIPDRDKLLQAATDHAKAALDNVQALYDDQKIDTDAALLRAVWKVADVVAQQSRGRDIFFINESWTVTSGTLEDPNRGVSAGIAVAAVGNAPGRVVNSDVGAVDFARECTSTNSVLAVLNVVPTTGLACNSSIIRDDLIDDTFAASYDGEVLPGPSETRCLSGEDLKPCVCGTSFSAPRIAWMLALSEAVRATDLDYTVWNMVLKNKVKKLRMNSATQWSGLYLHAADLLK